MPPAFRIGCSGWNYQHWRGNFYSPELPVREWFTHYSRVFDTVEINNTFYRLPESDTFIAWRERAPENFLYAIKASRFLTHLKRLREPEEAVSRLFERRRPILRTLRQSAAARLGEPSRRTVRAGHDVFAYFNNDPEGMAVTNAQELRSLMIRAIEGDAKQRRMR